MYKSAQFVIDYALSLTAQGIKQDFTHLLGVLNQNGCLSQRGQPYRGNRGVARLVAAAYALAVRQGIDPTPIAEAFTNQNGDYAYA